METNTLLRSDAGEVVARCSTNREADAIVESLVADGAEPSDLVLVAHGPTPMVLPDATRRRWPGVVAGIVVAALAAIVLPSPFVVGVVAAAVAVAVHEAVARRRPPTRVLVADAYDVVRQAR